MNKKEKKIENNGAICGGCISESTFMQNPDAYMMSFVMKDVDFDSYVELCKLEDKAKKTKFFEEHARSVI